MILNFTQKRAYTCKFMNGGVEDSFLFYPGDNKIPNSKAKALMAHPGIKNRFDLGLLIEKKSMTEDLAKEAAEISKAKKAKQAKQAKESEEGEEAKEDKKAKK